MGSCWSLRLPVGPVCEHRAQQPRYCRRKPVCTVNYGLKANLLIDLRGVVVGITSTAANIDERDSAYDILQAIEGLVLDDQGYIRPQCKAASEALDIDLQTPVRKNMKERRPRWWLKLLKRLRQRIDNVIAWATHCT